jgi:hypothetical protein
MEPTNKKLIAVFGATGPLAAISVPLSGVPAIVGGLSIFWSIAQNSAPGSSCCSLFQLR